MDALAKAIFSQMPKMTSGVYLPALSQCGRYSASAAVKEPQQKPQNGRTECDFEELNNLMSSFDEQVSLIDVRSDAELEQCGSIPGAIHIPLQAVKEALQMSDEEFQSHFYQRKPSKKDRNLIFYARGPNASSAALEIAHKLGFRGSRQYAGGWEDFCKRTGNSLKKVSDSPSPYMGAHNRDSFRNNRFYM